MKVLGSCLAVLLVAGSACGEEERDSGIYGSGSSVTLDGADDLGDSGSGESNDAAETTTGSSSTTTTDGGETTTTTDGGETTTTTSTSTDDGNPACGNGVIDGGEQCDGANLAGMTCIGLGFTGGELACDPSICVFDAAGCTNEGANQCDQYCNGCTCPSDECTICCAQAGKADVCGGGMCGCF